MLRQEGENRKVLSMASAGKLEIGAALSLRL
jgi:hypothetical protein